MDTRLIESEKTRRKILLAAKKEFATKGFSGTKVRSIAAVAGVDKSLIHYHFSKKEKIYLKVFQILTGEIFRKYMEKSISEVDSWSVTPDLKLSAALYLLVNYELFVLDDEFHRLISHEIAGGTRIVYQLEKEYLLPQVLALDNVIKEGVEGGYFEISDTTMFAINIISFIRDFSHSETLLKNMSMREEMYENKLEFIYNFILEFSFKALKPEKKVLIIPALDQFKKNILISILNDMIEDTKNNMAM